MNSECPECFAEIALDNDCVVSEILQCSDCGVELELVSLSPPKLETAPEEEEDWGE